MGTVDYRSLAEGIVREAGGEDNIAGATHCATRLRLKLRDESKADKGAIEKLPGVLTVMQAGGQYQVVIGNNVPIVYKELEKVANVTGESAGGDAAPGGNLFNRFIDLVSSIFQPILWPLAGAGLLKAFLSMFTQFGWLDSESQTYVILAAAADALFYFLPLFLAVTAARRFKANQFTAMAIGGALVYPSIVALAEAAAPVQFAGLPVVIMSYTSSVVPIIIAVWLQSHLERFLDRVTPATFRNFTTPLFTLVVMVPLVLITVGPITTYAARGLSAGITAAFAFAPWLAGAILGGLWQVFVLFGLHWGLVPIMTNDLATQGYSMLLGPLVAAVLAQAAAALAIMFRTHNKARRELAGPAAFSGFLAGVTEPAIYGVNLPLKKPFYFGIAGGAIGGAIASSGGSAATAFVFPSLLALPAYTQVGSFLLQVIGVAAAVVVAFTLTWLFGPRETEQVDAAEGTVQAASLALKAGTVTVQAPVSGQAVALDAVPDKVFASGALGHGLGIVPTVGLVYAPVSGTVISAMKAGHAYGIKSPEGVEVLVHVGIDTVNLAGRGFAPAVTQGQQVRAGDLLAEVDLGVVAEAGFDPTTVVVVTNTAQLAAVEPTDVTALQHGDSALLVRV